jgi:hypothetical protein
MKLTGAALILTLALAGCTANAADTYTDLDTFDESLANFQKHLQTCRYPAAHIMAFAKSWNLPEFAIQAYAPKGVDHAKGKTSRE